MKLGINYSPQAKMLAEQQAIELDLFKCPSASESVVREYAPTLLQDAGACRPIYIHFPLHTSNGSLATTKWDEIEEVLDQTETPYINVHLQAQTKDFPGMAADTHAPEDAARLTEAFIRDITELTVRFGPDRVIVENVVYRGAEGKVLYPCIDPAIFSRVVSETNCGLLLDTAHARLTCLALGIDAKEYIAKLPMSRLKELHVTGAQFDGTRLRDSMPMGTEDWDLIEWVLQQVREGHFATPWALAFEYGGVGPGFEWRSEADVIAKQLPRLRKLTETI